MQLETHISRPLAHKSQPMPQEKTPASTSADKSRRTTVLPADRRNSQLGERTSIGLPSRGFLGDVGLDSIQHGSFTSLEDNDAISDSNNPSLRSAKADSHGFYAGVSIAWPRSLCRVTWVKTTFGLLYWHGHGCFTKGGRSNLPTII